MRTSVLWRSGPQRIRATPRSGLQSEAQLVAPATVSPSPSGHALTGTFVLLGSAGNWAYLDPNNPSAGCRGLHGYDDFGPGMDVVVKDQAGTIIGSGTTIAGIASIQDGCSVTFTVTVPDAPFYAISVGHRGTITKSAADLAAAGWHIDLSLGG